MWWRRRPSDTPPTPQEAAEERISAYLDGEVTDSERDEIEALLASDATAREHLDDLRMMRAAFASLGEVRAPRSFAIPAPASGAAPVAAASTFGGRSMLLVRRMEWAMRASAAGAALLFVVAVTTNPGGETPIASVPVMSERTAAEDAPSAFSAGAGEAEASGAADADAGTAGGGASADAPSADGTPSPGTDTDPDRELHEGPDGASSPGVEDDAGAGSPPGDGVDGAAPGTNEDASDDAGEGDDGDDGEAVTTMMVPNNGPEGAEEGTADGSAGDSQKRYEPVEESAQLRVPEPGTIGVASASDGVGGVAPALATLAVLLTALSVLLARKDEAGAPDRR